MRPLTLRMLAAFALVGAMTVGADLAGAETTRQSVYAGGAGVFAPGVFVLALSDVRIDQAKGRVRAGKLPEMGNQKKSGNANADANRPITCDASNATTPGCYTATQQTRPIAK